MLPQVLFWAFGLYFIIFKNFSHLFGVRRVGGCVSSEVLGSSTAVAIRGLVSRLLVKKQYQDSKIEAKTLKTSWV